MESKENLKKSTKKSKIRWWALLISVLFIIISVGISTYFSNQTYFNNETDYRNISNENITIEGWQLEEDGWLLNDSGLVTITNLDSYVGSVRLEGQFQNLPENIAIYFTKPGSEVGAEAEKLEISPEISEDGMVLAVHEDVGNLAIDFSDAPMVEWLSDGTISVDSTHFKVKIQILALSVLLAILLSIPFYYDRSAYGKVWMYLKGSKRYFYLLQNLVSRDITTKYRRSTLGILWSVLNPLLMMLVITMVFQHIFRSDIDNFPIYYLTGSLIFNFVVEATNGAMMSILGSSSLIKKVYIPKYIFPLEKTVFALVNMLFSLIAVVIIMLAQQFVPSWTIILIPIPILYTFIFCIGLGMILASLNVFFRDISHLWGVFTTAWMYLTPIIYPIQSLPGAVQELVKINPLYYYVDYFRQVVMYGTVPNLTTNAVCIFLSLTFLVFGIIIFKKTQDQFILHI